MISMLQLKLLEVLYPRQDLGFASQQQETWNDGISTHLSVKSGSHSDNVSCLAVNRKHILRWALWGLSHDSVSHHPVRCSAIICVICRHCHHVGTLEKGKIKHQDYGIAEQIAVPVTPGMHFTQKCYTEDIPFPSSQLGKARIMKIATLLRLYDL